MKHDSQSQLNGTGGSPFDPYDADRPLLMRCACGQDHAPIEHGAQTPDPVRHSNDFIEAALVKALLPQESLRRRFLKLVGADAARAAIASVLPVTALQAMAHDRLTLEKKDLKIGFIAITCATPLIPNRSGCTRKMASMCSW